eukprot:330600-Chlamydomonas_euryale.AAC.1
MKCGGLASARAALNCRGVRRVSWPSQTACMPCVGDRGACMPWVGDRGACMPWVGDRGARRSESCAGRHSRAELAAHGPWRRNPGRRLAGGTGPCLSLRIATTCACVKGMAGRLISSFEADSEHKNCDQYKADALYNTPLSSSVEMRFGNGLKKLLPGLRCAAMTVTARL